MTSSGGLAARPRLPFPWRASSASATSPSGTTASGSGSAEADGRIVGSAIAVLREQVWYLAALHVVPRFQAQGVGTELLRRSLAGVGPDTILTVATDALNPASNGLYLRFGMLPQETHPHLRWSAG